MESLIYSYVNVIHEYDKSIADGSSQFIQNMEACNTFQKKRARYIIDAAQVLLRETKGERKEKPIVDISPPPLTVRNWWELFVQERYPDEKCLENLRCSRKTYFYLTKVLRPFIRPRLGATPQRKALNMVKGVSVEKQVAITLHKLAISEDYAVVSGMFGIHKSTVHKVFHKVISAINKHLLHKTVNMPDKKEIEYFVQSLEENCKIPQIMGVIKSTHIPIYPPAHMVPVFTNTSDYTSFVAQVVVDPHCCFRDISIRHPGSTQDRLVLEDSNIYKYANRVIPSVTRNINGIQVPYKIVGSMSYPLLPWLTTGYRDPASQSDLLFNACISEIENYANVALEKLKARFIILSRSIDVSFKVAPQIIAACCTLHNICERNEDPFIEEWLDGIKEFSEKFPQPEKMCDLRIVEQSTLDQRNAMRDYLDTHNSIESPAFTYANEDNVLLTKETVKVVK